ncbi:MAG TPA: hypothetical protein VFJ58_30240 [Armatimonadota bacterium]|nr:hypothetical protein [Armatimonadota bacterium]
MYEKQALIPAPWLGLLVGLFLGFIAVWLGLGKAIAVGICGLAGYWFAAFRQGDVDLIDQLSRLQARGRVVP